MVIIADQETYKVLAEGKMVDGLYRMSLYLNKDHHALSPHKITVGRWHARLEHLNEKSIRQLVNKDVLPNDTICKNIANCHSCAIQKFHNLSLKESVRCYSPL